MVNLVLLPATEPGDKRYGVAPEQIAAYPAASIHQIRYPTMVWYNETIRREAIAQILSLDVGPVILVGFSKSGLGAWNIARAIPDRVSGTIIFDAPVASEDRHRWSIDQFYPDDTSWHEDLPIHTVGEFQAAMPKTHRLVLISGKSFHKEMCTLSQTLTRTGLDHSFLPRPHLKHHWDSGWLEEGLSEVQGRERGTTNEHEWTRMEKY